MLGVVILIDVQSKAQILKNIKEILNAAGSSLENVVGLSLPWCVLR
jgi:enamine deaminase RidA (YjgF/YER057c/UK114 family)